MDFHIDRKTGAISQLIERVPRAFKDIFWSLFYLIPTVIEMMTVFIILMYLYGYQYTLVMVGLMIGYGIITHCTLSILDTKQEEYNAQRKHASALCVDSLLNIETVKYFNNKRLEYERYDYALQQQAQAGAQYDTWDAVIQGMQAVVIGVSFIYIVWLSARQVISGALSIGDFILINGYFFQFISPLDYFNYIVRQIKKGVNDMQELISLLEINPEIKDDTHAVALQLPIVKIEFHGVCFRYIPERALLENVSFTICQGQTIALVGPTGSGKSTITRLLFRFYDVTSGVILCNDQNIKMVTQKSLHRAIGVVSQDTHLFNDTLYYNIAYGRPTAALEEVEKASRLACLDTLINKLPQRYNTVVGERGLKLSGGEKQRIAIARVLLKNPSLYILDEATSHLDNATEREIQRNLKVVLQGKTMFIIAHRLSTITHADEILVLKNGMIIERGDHTRLLAKKGLYFNLWCDQH